MTSILWFNNVQFSWCWPTTIPLTVILKWFGLLKSDNKSMHLKLCESTIISVPLFHYACHICWRSSFKIVYYFCSFQFWCRHLGKTISLDDVINDIMMSTPSPTFHALETSVTSLSNDIWHLTIALEQKYLLNFKTVSDILDHPVSLFTAKMEKALNWDIR